MKKIIFKSFGFAFALAAILFAVGGAFGFFDLSFLNGGEDFLYLGAVAPVASAAEASRDTVTTHVQNEKSPELLLADIDEVVTKIYADEFPFDTIMRHSGITKNVDSYETKYYSVTSRGINDTVNGAISAVTGGAENATLDIVVDNAHIWTRHDVLMVADAGGSDPIGQNAAVVGSDGLELTFLVVSITDDTLTCIPLNGTGTNGTDTPAIADGANLVRIGHAKSELDATTDPYSVQPKPKTNYCQTNMAMVEESFIAKAHKKEVKWDMNDLYDQSMWDFKSMNEFIGLKGYKSLVYDPVAKDYKYTAGGIVREISNNITWDISEGLGNDTFQEWAKEIFDGNNGARTRVLFVGSEFMQKLGGVPTVSKQLDGANVEVVWGVKFNKIESNFGTFLVKLHPGFTKLGMGHQALALDMNFVEKHVFVPLKTDQKDLIKPGIRKANATVIDETFCMILKNPGVHGLITIG